MFKAEILRYKKISVFLSVSLILAGIFIILINFVRAQEIEDVSGVLPEFLENSQIKIDEREKETEGEAREEQLAPVAEAVALPKEIEEQLEEVVRGLEVSEDVRRAIEQDTDIFPADLGQGAPRVLPDSPLYIFKKLGRGIRKALTFDNLKKAELELKYADSELLEAKTLVEEKGEEAVPGMEKALNSFKDDMESLAGRFDLLKEEHGDSGKDLDKLKEILADRQIKHQKILEKLEGQLPPEALEAVKQARESSLERSAEVFSKFTNNPEELEKIFIKVLENQEGSEFKNFKNLEIISGMQEKLQEKAPDIFTGAIDGFKDKVFNQLLGETKKLSVEARQENFRLYVEHAPGQPGVYVELCDEFKQFMRDADPANIDPEFLNQFNVVKEAAFTRLENDLNGSSLEEVAKFLKPFSGGRAGDLRMLSQLKDRDIDLPDDAKQEIAALHQSSINKFKEKFSSDPKALKSAIEVEELFKRVRENPDALDFKILEELRSGLSEEQQKFILEVEADGSRGLQAKFKSLGVDFRAFTSDPTDPNSLKTLEELRDRLPQEARVGIDRAISAQRSGLREHVENLNDPVILAKIQAFLSRDEDLKASFEKGDLDFFENLEKKVEEKTSRARELFLKRLDKLKEGFLMGDIGSDSEIFAPDQEFGAPPKKSLEQLRRFQEMFQKGEFEGFVPFTNFENRDYPQEFLREPSSQKSSEQPLSDYRKDFDERSSEEASFPRQEGPFFVPRESGLESGMGGGAPAPFFNPGTQNTLEFNGEELKFNMPQPGSTPMPSILEFQGKEFIFPPPSGEIFEPSSLFEFQIPQESESFTPPPPTEPEIQLPFYKGLSSALS